MRLLLPPVSAEGYDAAGRMDTRITLAGGLANAGPPDFFVPTSGSQGSLHSGIYDAEVKGVFGEYL